MSRISNQQVITDIQNGNADILFYLSSKYFQGTRKWLRRKGIPDANTPDLFTTVLLHVYREIQLNRVSPNVEFESYFFNAIEEYLQSDRELKARHEPKIEQVYSDEQCQIVAQCVGIMDEHSQKLLFSRYAEKLSFEQIAARFDFSNPFIAQAEVNKAFNQLQGITTLRLNISRN